MKQRYAKQDYQEHWDQNFYQTGVTQPPKHHSGIVPVLLVLVVLLSGLTSILSILNIKLFSQINGQDKEQAALSLKGSEDHFAQSQILEDPTGIVSCTPGLDITVEAITTVYQRHFQLPEGLFITNVSEGSDAEARGLLEGDVLLYLDDQKLSDVAGMNAILRAKKVGDTVMAVVFRNATNQKISLELMVEDIITE